MHSSTSSSRRTRVRNPAPYLLWAALGFLVVAIPCGWLAVRAELFAPLEEAAQYREVLLETGTPTGDLYLAYDVGSPEHFRFAHDIGGVIEPIRQASVLFLGNSRVQFAFRPEALERFEKEEGIEVYNLGLGYWEQDRFPRTVIEKFDLRPALIVVNADAFFSDGITTMGKRALQSGRWSARQYVAEQEIAFDVRKRMHRVLPLLSVTAHSQWVFFRSRELGSWQVWTGACDEAAIEVSTRHEIRPREIRPARDFIAAMRARGSEVVLTYVPHPGGKSTRYLQDLAEALEVPWIAPVVEGLVTCDGSHLDPRSAEVFSGNFFRQLRSSEVFERAVRR